MDHRRIAALNDWLAGHHGVVSRQVLGELGFDDGGVGRLVRSGRLDRIARGAYRTPTVPLGRLQLMVAACLLAPEAAIGFTTAGQEWRFRGMTDPRVHVLLPHHLTLHLVGVEVHRCRRIDPVDIVAARSDGVRLTSPPRTLFDSAAIVGPDATESAVEQALMERRCTVPTLTSTMRRLRHGNRPGSAVFEGVLLARPQWRRAARSELERLLRAAIDQAGLPPAVVNLRMEVDGEPIEIDLAWPQWRLAVEVDHPFWHDGRREARRDKRRDRKLAARGWLTVRVTDADVDDALPDALADLRAVLVARGWRPGRAA